MKVGVGFLTEISKIMTHLMGWLLLCLLRKVFTCQNTDRLRSLVMVTAISFAEI